MSPAEVTADQRIRLQVAMVEAVAGRGYEAVTIGELARLAGVSRTTIYEHFDGKLDCFLATFDAIVAEASRRVDSAYRSREDSRERLIAALTVLMDLVVAEPKAAALVVVESSTLGAAGARHRERGSEPFEEMVRESFQHSRSRIVVPDTVVRAIVGGIGGVVCRRLRAEAEGDLPGLVPELTDWALSYQRPPSAARNAAVRAAGEPVTVEPKAASSVPFSEPPASARSKRELRQRERILRGAAHVVVDHGYEALSIPTISAAAGTSNQTFYEYFGSKRDAFLAAFELAGSEALGHASAAYGGAGDRPEAVGAGIRALLEYIAHDEYLARLALLEAPAAGPAGLDRAEKTLAALTACLRPPLAPTAVGGPVSDVVIEAVGAGSWAVIQYEITHGRRERLASIAPDLCAVALAPFAAARTAR